MIDLEQLLLSLEPSDTDPPPVLPVVRIPKYIELVPDRLAARVYSHEITVQDETFPCWTYVSDGLRQFGQRELIFTLRREEHEPAEIFPRDPLTFFTDLLNVAETHGRTFQSGDFTRIMLRKPFLGLTGQVGFAYVPPIALRGVNWPAPPLAAILMHPEETRLAAKIGTHRVLARLSQQQRHYPNPYWSERGRPGTVAAGELEKSIVSRVPAILLSEAHATRVANRYWIDADELPRYGRIVPEHDSLGQTVHLTLPQEATTKLKATLGKLPPQAPLAILTPPESSAESRLVWRFDLQKTQQVAKPGVEAHRAAGNFVMFLADESFQEGVFVIEDGFLVRLKPATWAKVRDALMGGQPWFLPGYHDSMSLCLKWDWPAKALLLGGVTYQPDEVVRERIGDRAAFLRYLRTVKQCVNAYFAGERMQMGSGALLALVLRPGEAPRYWLEGPGSEAEDGLREMLAKVEAPGVMGGPVAFGLPMHLWGGPGDDDEKVPYAPDAWLKGWKSAGGKFTNEVLCSAR